MPTTNSTVLFKAGLQAAYNGITTKDLNTVYFITDTQRLFVGETEYTRPVQHGTNLPTGYEPPNSLFVLETGSVKDLYFSADGASWTQIAHLPAPLADGIFGVAKGSATKVPQITVDKFGNVTDITEVDIDFPDIPDITVTGNTAEGNAITGITASGHTVTVTKGTMATSTELSTHTNNKSNPHGVTAAQVGLGNVDNTADADKPVSTLQAEAIADAKKAGTDAQTYAEGVASDLSDHEADTTAHITAEERTAWNGEIGAKELAGSKVASVSGKDAIAVTTGTTPEVSLKLDNSGNVQLSQTATGLKAEVTIPAATVTGVKSGDKVLALDGTELTSTLSLTYDNTADSEGKKYIRLKGIGGTDIATIDTAEFIKDGMVSNVTFEPTTKILTITFNTDSGKEAVTVDLTSLVDTYTAGNGIDITGNVVSAKISTGSESFLSADETGLKVTGVQTAINTAKSDVIGTDDDFATADTIKGVKKAAAAAQAAADAAQETADKAVVANPTITAGTHTKITYDAKGLVTSGEDLAATDIPNLDASKITSGVFAVARIPDITLAKVTDAGTAAAKDVATDAIAAGSTDTNLVTAQQVAAFVNSQSLTWGSF